MDAGGIDATSVTQKMMKRQHRRRFPGLEYHGGRKWQSEGRKWPKYAHTNNPYVHSNCFHITIKQIITAQERLYHKVELSENPNNE